MYLAEALGVASAEELDPGRPLILGRFELGVEATAEALRILAGEDFPRQVSFIKRTLSHPLYWSLVHRTEGSAEVFGFPQGGGGGLPTAIEIALVRAIAASAPKDHAELLEGDAQISLGPPAAYRDFGKLIEVVSRPMAGNSLLYDGATQAIIEGDVATRLNKVALSCLANSFQTAPIKFRFLELYRMMEARFLADIKGKLLTKFDAEPNAALGEAVDALKSEMSQIISLAETQQVAFESCWTELHALKNTNRFTAAVFRRAEDRGNVSGDKWRTGAALVYQIRCAVVHAGNKDIIFENFQDGVAAITAVLPHVERAALLLVGVDLS